MRWAFTCYGNWWCDSLTLKSVAGALFVGFCWFVVLRRRRGFQSCVLFVRLLLVLGLAGCWSLLFTKSLAMSPISSRLMPR